MSTFVDVLLGLVIPGLCIAAAFAAGWIARSNRERQLQRKLVHNRRVRGARSVVSREGTTPSNVKKVTLNRGGMTRGQLQ